ncbi:COPII vesicle coat protein Sec16 [Rasamsonia emersonii CBS 393.64]|uniref:Protein transport protein sec16 n=1 Tax=Rasamsonia emersonii (strain ATCC 16479 / CBS 393.64 / IMI 116815) TaxID=1408163 RepID=A0A0F4Z4G4_RASE3|nr:COPII vesicle coat protein Sec16 [Rasamsonia emersonii CBS 393.64]KKA25407.1 COPII vesicle coat protein Sec16 [Rasamsonia emersonii CBS 393.64]
MSIPNDNATGASLQHDSQNSALTPEENLSTPIVDSTQFPKDAQQHCAQESALSGGPQNSSEQLQPLPDETLGSQTEIASQENGTAFASDRQTHESEEEDKHADADSKELEGTQESPHVQSLSQGQDVAHADPSSQESPRDSDPQPSLEASSSQDPFKREDIIGRTNSFPPVQNTETTPEQGAEVPQRDDIGDGAPEASKHEDAAPHGVTNGEVDQSNGVFWEDSMHEDGEDDFFGQLKTQTKPIYVPPEADSRFEEGVPLVEDVSGTQEEPTVQAESSIKKVFDGDADEGDDFFSSAAQKASADTQHPAITRKSTSQVLGSLNYDTLNSPINEPPVESLQSSHDAGAEAPGDASNTAKTSEDEDLAARWQAELEGDDDLLLDEEPGNQAPVTQEAETGNAPELLNGVSHPESGSQFGAQQTPTPASVQSNPYAPHQPSSSELVQGLPVAPYSQAPGVAASPYSMMPAQEQQGATTEKAESFVNKKDGYKSPYDLPDSFARPRRPAARKAVPPPGTTMPTPPPPPRSSSNPAVPPPPVSNASPQASGIPPAKEPVPPPKNFYEELPPPPKQRPASRGRYTPQSTTAPSVGPPPASSLGSQSSAPPPPTVTSGVDNFYQCQLQPPERVGPYTNLSVPNAPAGPGSGPRYSPKPPAVSAGTKPPSSPRYSPAPAPQSSTSPVRNRYASQPAVAHTANSLPFQPRTSSPLAHHEKHAYGPQESHERPSTSSDTLSPPRTYQPPQTQEQLPQSGQTSGYAASETGKESEKTSDVFTHQPSVQPTNPYAPVSNATEPSRRRSTESPYVPGSGVTGPQIPTPAGEIQFAPPRRSQTQSPGRQMNGPSLSISSAEPFQRPASVHNSSSPAKAVNPYASPYAAVSNREVSQQAFIPPTDGQELDPLERWKGAPVFKFGFGGVITSCFPQHIPRYSAGQMTPMIKPAPGEVKIQQLKDIVPSSDKIQDCGPRERGGSGTLQSDPDPYKRHDEKILLWKMIRVLVENDGVLEGTADIQKSLRNIISPGLQSSETDATYGGGQTTSGLYQPTNGSVRSDAIDAGLLGLLRNDLLVGDREKAVWRAADNRLWGHAMIMSSLDKSLWKQVVQEFVRREVRSAGENIESLAALYEIFSGNLEESIDELVPPSARVGLQMVSRTDGHGPTKNALDGLDRWRETLGLILNNRSPDDHRALFALGQLLSSYGRTEAAHICYVFARAFSPAPIFGGVDDPQASIVLLGVDHRRFPFTFWHDDDAILLTEVYEFATSVLAGNSAAVLPHLQSFKLQHAYQLAEKGYKSDAQQYCDAIAGILKATTRPSPYYHQRLFSEVEELSTRLREAPGDGTSSWISKPSMEKVSGSMWAKFSSFVAGDDNDEASTASGKAGDADVGPFAKVTGTPTISRSPSTSDLYGSCPMAQPVSSSSSRYTPGNQFALSSSPEQYRSRSSMDSQKSPPMSVNYTQRRGSQDPSTPVDGSPYVSASFNTHGTPPYAYHSTPQSSYTPLAPVEEDLPSQSQQPQPAPSQDSALTSGLRSGSDSFGQPLDHSENADTETSQNTGYEPPTASSGYEPPSYQPDAGTASDEEEESQEEEKKPKKKSFMDDDDDDDDLAARAAALQKAEKERRDREVDEAVRRAAEADAQRPAQPAKRSWFGSWFGGRKDDSSSNKPIKANLGEENSFYYDPNLKKWVNKKDPNSANAAARATPPPPKGPAPPSRSASGSSSAPPAGGPTMASQSPPSSSSRPSTGTGAPPSRSESPALSSPGAPLPGAPNGPPRSVSTASAPGATPPSSSSGQAPPPRPSLSNASSIDDLLGAPQARKGNTTRGKKKGRGYVDVMAR